MINIKNIVKGVFIGVGKIIPGVSGSLIALNLGIYEQLISSINRFFFNKKDNIIFLLNVGTGIFISIIFGSKIINFLLSKYYFLTMMLFLGLIIGTMKEITARINISKKNINIYIISILFLVIALMQIKNNSIYIYKNSLMNNIYVIALGFIEALTMIVPGVSGTAIFIMLGCYDFVIKLLSNPFNNIFVMILFSIGLFIGIILITKMMDFLFSNHSIIIYPVIFCFSVSSIFILFIKTIDTKPNNLLVGLLLLFAGYIISNTFNKE